MGLIVGPTPWWQSSLIAQCPVGTILLDGSRIICKAGGTAWIVAPSCTQVSERWAGGQYNTTEVGNKCCICEWSGLETATTVPTDLITEMTALAESCNLPEAFVNIFAA